MAFRLAPCALISLLSYNLVIVVDAATSQPPTSVRFFTDSNCKSLFATVQTAANVGNGQCGILPAGISSASAVFLDDGCFHDCSDGATAVRLNECTALSAASFSIDCPGINGTNDPGYTTLTAEGTPSTTSATPVVLPTDEAKSSAVALGSTTAPEQSLTNIPGPSSAVLDPLTAHNPSSTPSSFTTTSTSSPATLSPSQSSTISPLTPSPSTSRNSQTSLQSFSSSSSSTPSPSPSSTPAQQGTSNNGSLSGRTKLILAIVFPIAGIVALILGILWINHQKTTPPSKQEPEHSPSTPISTPLPYPGQSTAELDGDRGGELDARPNSGRHELGSRALYEMADMRGVKTTGMINEMGIQELTGDGEHPRELD